MMPALPQTSTAPMPSLLAMLTPVQGGDAGEAGAFDQLVAAQTRGTAPVAAPVVPTAAPAAAAAMPITVATPVAPAQVSPNAPAPALPTAITVEMPAAAAPIQIAPVAAPATPQTPAIVPQPARPALPLRVSQVALPQELAPTEDLPVETATPGKPEAAPTEKAVLAANELLATLAQFTVPAGKPAGAKPAIALPATEGEGASEGEAPVAAEATPMVALLASAAAPAETRPAGKPAADMAPTAKPRRDDAPALPVAAPKVRGDAPALPMMAALEPAAPKPAAEPSMTVLFAQPATAATTALAAAAPVATIAERTLDLSSDDAWIEQLAADIAATKSASGDISFRLMPRHLGRLDVSMIAGDEGVSVKLDTQHEATATIVTAAQTRLADDLRQQGVRVADTQVTCTPNETGRQSQQGQGRSGAQDASHLIETADDRAEARPETRDERSGERRGRFA
jgi:flagellar hook-length control protein FliK